jgi:hypothetical protein
LGIRSAIEKIPDPTLKDAAEKAAADDRRSLTGLIVRLLEQHLRKRGYLPKPMRIPRQGSRGF